MILQCILVGNNTSLTLKLYSKRHTVSATTKQSTAWNTNPLQQYMCGYKRHYCALNVKCEGVQCSTQLTLQTVLVEYSSFVLLRKHAI
jgi:hypothetical protein